MKKPLTNKDINLQCRGIHLIKQETFTVSELAEELIGVPFAINLDIHRRIPVPLSIDTSMRINLICENYDISQAKLLSSLIDIALPELEKELEITEEDICNFFNKNKPEGCEENVAMPSKEYFEKLKNVEWEKIDIDKLINKENSNE